MHSKVELHKGMLRWYLSGLESLLDVHKKLRLPQDLRLHMVELHCAVDTQYYHHIKKYYNLKLFRSKQNTEGLMLKLKLEYLGRLMQRTDSFEKTLMLGKTEGRRRRG